jgi:NitT/TauT family transport system substrate-binding protein
MKKTARKTARLLVAAFMIFVFTGKGYAQSAQSEDLTIYAFKGPSAVNMIKMFESPPVSPGFNVKLEALAAVDLLLPKFVSGEAKVGILPANVAAKIASSGKKIQVAAVTGTGMLTLLSSDPSVKRIEDLKGKTVEVAGQGATPDYVFRKILFSKGIDPEKDINLTYSLGYPEMAQSLIAGRIPLALLPEPFTTMAKAGKPDLAEVSNIQDEWVKIGGAGHYPMTVLVLDAEFAAGHRPLITAILKDLSASISWVNNHPQEAGILVEKYDLGLKAPVVTASIPKSNYIYIPAQRARPSLEALYRAFLQFSPQSIGGALPGNDFYYR